MTPPLQLPEAAVCLAWAHPEVSPLLAIAQHLLSHLLSRHLSSSLSHLLSRSLSHLLSRHPSRSLLQLLSRLLSHHLSRSLSHLLCKHKIALQLPEAAVCLAWAHPEVSPLLAVVSASGQLSIRCPATCPTC